MLTVLALAFAVADPVPPTPPAERSVAAAVAVVRSYYDAIGRHDYARAHAIFANGHSVAALRRGYADTRAVTVTPVPPFDTDAGMGQVHAEIRVVVDATLKSGARRRYAGSYILNRVNDIDGSTAAQRRWHIVSGHLKAVSAG